MNLTMQDIGVYAYSELSAGRDAQKVSKAVAAILSAQGWSMRVAEFERAYEAVLRLHGYETLEVSSPLPLTKTMLQKVYSYFGSSRPLFAQTKDPDVLSGLRARTSEKQLDASGSHLLRIFTAEARS